MSVLKVYLPDVMPVVGLGSPYTVGGLLGRLPIGASRIDIYQGGRLVGSREVVPAPACTPCRP